MNTARQLIKDTIELLECTYIRASSLNDLNQKVIGQNLQSVNIGVHYGTPEQTVQRFGATKSQFVTYPVNVHFLQLTSGADDTAEQMDIVYDTCEDLANSFYDIIKRNELLALVQQPTEYSITTVETTNATDERLTGVEVQFDIIIEKKKYNCEKKPLIIEGYEYPAGTEFIEFEVAPPRKQNLSERLEVSFSIKAIDGLSGINSFDIIYNGFRQQVTDSNSNAFFQPSGRTDNSPLPKLYIVSILGWDKLEEIATINSSSRMYAFSSTITDYIPKMTNLKNIFWYSMQGIDWWQFFTCPNLEVFNFLQSQNGKNIKMRLPASLIEFRINGPNCAPFVINEEYFGHLTNLVSFVCFFGSPVADYLSGADKWSAIATVDIRSMRMPSESVDRLIIDLDIGGVSNGTLNYSANGTPTSASYQAYIDLINKGWTITGTPPPAP